MKKIILIVLSVCFKNMNCMDNNKKIQENYKKFLTLIQETNITDRLLALSLNQRCGASKEFAAISGLQFLPANIKKSSQAKKAELNNDVKRLFGTDPKVSGQEYNNQALFNFKGIAKL